MLCHCLQLLIAVIGVKLPSVNCAQESNTDQAAVEHDGQSRLERLREDMESEHQGRCEDLEKKYAYKMEQLRQDLADKHEQVIAQLCFVTLDCHDFKSYRYMFVLHTVNHNKPVMQAALLNC